MQTHKFTWKIIFLLYIFNRTLVKTFTNHSPTDRQLYYMKSPLSNNFLTFLVLAFQAIRQ